MKEKVTHRQKYMYICTYMHMYLSTCILYSWAVYIYTHVSFCSHGSFLFLQLFFYHAHTEAIVYLETPSQP